MIIENIVCGSVCKPGTVSLQAYISIVNFQKIIANGTLEMFSVAFL